MYWTLNSHFFMEIMPLGWISYSSDETSVGLTCIHISSMTLNVTLESLVLTINPLIFAFLDGILFGSKGRHLIRLIGFNFDRHAFSKPPTGMNFAKMRFRRFRPVRILTHTYPLGIRTRSHLNNTFEPYVLYIFHVLSNRAQIPAPSNRSTHCPAISWQQFVDHLWELDHYESLHCFT